MDGWSGFVGLVVVLGVVMIDRRLYQILKELRKLTTNGERHKAVDRG